MPTDAFLDGCGALRPGDAKFVVALAALDIFPRQLCELVFRDGAEAAWRRVRAGAPRIAVGDHVAARWRALAIRLDPDEFWAAHEQSAIGVAMLGSPAYPPELVDDAEAPLVLFYRGDPDHRAGPRVAIIGTRRASAYGLGLATDWAQALSEAGVSVVSGLALGIDAAAHQGALRGPTAPIGVVGSGLDVVYPRRNESLWHEVGERGWLLSEYPLGVSAAAHHFPARNRIIAALADVVLVVESHDKGGSLITVTAANARHCTVLAVPGSVHSSASRGTNMLLRDGAGVAIEVGDLLMALQMTPGPRRGRRDLRPAPTDDAVRVLDAFGWSPARLETLAARLGLSLVGTADALERLVRDRWVAAEHGWFERIAQDQVPRDRDGSP